MHIGLVIYGELDAVSGGYIYDKRLVQRLEARGHTVDVVSLPEQSYLSSIRHNWSSSIKQQLLDPKFDLLLQDELNHPSLFLLNKKIKEEQNIPIVSIVHHLRSSEELSFFERKMATSLEARYLQTIDGFVFNSETTRGVVEAVIGDEENRPFTVAYPGGDRFKYLPTKESVSEKCIVGGPLNILFVGNIIPRKGLHILLDALETLPRETWNLSVVGRADIDEQYALSMQKRAAGAPNVRFYGKLFDPEALGELYNNNQILILPSSYEGFGIVYLEAMAFGLPVIASDAGAAHEIVQHNKTGYLVDHRALNFLSYHVSTLYYQRDKLEEMSLAAYDWFRQYPTWEQSMDKAADFIESMATNN